MKAAVFDTYVRKSDKSIMHFDIVVPEKTGFEQVQQIGKKYLAGKGYPDLPLTSKECRFCHIEQANPVLEDQLLTQGYSIIELHNCN